MKIEMISRGSATHVYTVQLEGEEYDWSDARIITAVDRRGNLTEQEWERIERGEDHPCHFGGTVTPLLSGGTLSGWGGTVTPRLNPMRFEVTVYVD